MFSSETIFFLFLFNFELKFFLVSGLLRNKPAFQSSTETFPGHKTAEDLVDSVNSVSVCTQTDNTLGHKSWVAVDLEQYFEVTRVCLLNKQFSKLFKKI